MYYLISLEKKKEKKFGIFKSWINFLGYFMRENFSFKDKIIDSITLFKNKNDLIHLRIEYFTLDNNLHNILKYNPVFNRWKEKELYTDIFSIEDDGKCPYYNTNTNEGVYYTKLIHPLYDENYNKDNIITNTYPCKNVFTDILNSSKNKYSNQITEDKDFRANQNKHIDNGSVIRSLGYNQNIGRLFNQIIDYTKNYIDYNNINNEDQIEYILSSQLYNWIKRNKMYSNVNDYDKIIEDITKKKDISLIFQEIDGIKFFK